MNFCSTIEGCAVTISMTLAFLIAGTTIATAENAEPDYSTQVAPILTRYCAGCHNDEDSEGEFSVASYASLVRGATRGPAVQAGDPEASLLVRLLHGTVKPVMPPKGEPRPTDDEIALLESWITSGAKGPSGEERPRLALMVPQVPSISETRPVLAMDASRDGRWTAIARDSEVTLYEGSGESVTGGGQAGRTIGEHPGKVMAIRFTPDGERLVTASGVPGLGGVASIWNIADGSLIRRFEGHQDILYDAELSPDGSRLATCGYDKNIEIRDVSTGDLLRILEGHTGAVYDVAFSPDGRFLVSASADDTCKVWRVEDGLRLDTLPQPLRAETCCLFSPDGRTIVAGGADSNIRVWRFVSQEKPEINPMEIARFAHEGAIVRMGFSPDASILITLAEDRTVKAWQTNDYTEIMLWPDQSDVVSAFTFHADGASIDVGRMDGSLATYSVPEIKPDVLSTETAPTSAASSSTSASISIQESTEHEPNDDPESANPIQLPAKVSGVIDGGKAGADVDLYRFSARAGEQWVFEVDAARSGAKLDSFLEILDAQGRRIPRVLLQATRDSYFTFRGKNGSETGDFRVFNWEEMKINEYLYANGEVAKLWLFPRGPDSGFIVYPGRGDRWGFFDSTPLAHALNDPCYVVQPHAPGSKIVQNGLPVFTLYFENDDESRRGAGKDSRLTFTAPADGDYLIKIRDVRNLQGPDFRYTLQGRVRRPDFQVSLEGANPTVSPGTAREFKVSAQRLDEFDGPIRVDFDGVPKGFHVTSPLIIEEGQLDAFGVVSADDDAVHPDGDSPQTITAVATARIEGRDVSHDFASLGTVTLGPSAKLKVAITAAEESGERFVDPTDGTLEFTVEAGRTLTLKLEVDRIDFEDQVPFGNEGSGRNLPFGSFIDDLGLNGLLVTEDRSERTFFVTVDEIVPEQIRPFHLTTGAAGGVSSRPVRLRIVQSTTTVQSDRPAGSNR